MRIHKRSYSPSIDDLRQYNIKKQRLLDDLESLNLSSSNIPKHYETVQPQSTKNTEYIPDIDEFLLMNQDDRDVLESSKHITDIRDALDPDQIVIPEHVTRVTGLSKYDEQLSMERILGQRRMDYLLGRDGQARTITDEEILYDHEIRTNWSLVKYVPPWRIVYDIWEKWWMNVHKLDEFMRQMEDEDHDIVIDDDFNDMMDIGRDGMVYTSTPLDTDSDDDAMDID